MKKLLMKVGQVFSLLLISSASMAITVPNELLNPVRVAAGQIPDLDNLGHTQDIEAGGQWTHDYTVTSGDTSGWFGFETQTTRLNSLELWAIYDIYSFNYIELLALGESTFDQDSGLYTHTLQGFLDSQADASGWAVRLASDEAFLLTYLAPGICCSSDGPWIIRPEGVETLNDQRSRAANVSEPATLALFMLSLAGCLGLRRKINK